MDAKAGARERMNASQQTLIDLSHRIHANPELPHHEFETAAYVSRILTAAGLKPRLTGRGNGVICDIGHGDRVIEPADGTVGKRDVRHGVEASD